MLGAILILNHVLTAQQHRPARAQDHIRMAIARVSGHAIHSARMRASALAKRLGHDDPVAGKRIVSRLVENATQIKLERPDLRLRRSP